MLCNMFHDPDPVEPLFARAMAAGVSMAAICERAGVARSTPSRWRQDRNGANLATVRKLNSALSEIVAERASASVHDDGSTSPSENLSPGKSSDVTGAQVPA